jgi:hypothetical protein
VLSGFVCVIVDDFIVLSLPLCTSTLLLVGTRFKISKFDIKAFSMFPLGRGFPDKAKVTASRKYLMKNVQKEKELEV